MDRGAWQATVHSVARVRHDLATNTTIPAKNKNIAFPKEHRPMFYFADAKASSLRSNDWLEESKG